VRPAGLSPRLNVQYREGRNSNIQRRISNLDRFELEGGLGYSNPSLGTIELFGRFLEARYPQRLLPVAGGVVRDGFADHHVRRRL
jgi:hypothetical protein